MRNRLLLPLLTAAVVLAACADDQHTTGPASRSGPSSRSGSGDVTPTGQAIANPQAKPTDQVGFTKVAAVYGVPVNLAANASENATVACPVGSFSTGGGFDMVLTDVGSIPTIRTSRPTKTPAGVPDGWLISVTNIQPGAVAAQIQAWVLCAS
jgi:hypothetical protein